MLPKKLAASIVSLLLLSSAAIAQQASGYDSSQLTASSSSVDSLSSEGGIRPAPPARPTVQLESARPFHSLALGVTASTLGIGVEIASPLARSFNLRTGINYFSFNYAFSVDGLTYNSRLHLKSSASSVDWFPWHHSFHISPGILYAKNSMNAPISIGPGQPFTLGDQDFVNSVTDPTNGGASLVFPHEVAPMLTIGFGNLLPRSGHHISVPFEIGAAYTGAPQINVSLNGTACTNDGCVNFDSNAEAQSDLHQEVHDINEDLKRIPVFPILSIGFAYQF